MRFLAAGVVVVFLGVVLAGQCGLLACVAVAAVVQWVWLLGGVPGRGVGVVAVADVVVAEHVSVFALGRPPRSAVCPGAAAGPAGTETQWT